MGYKILSREKQGRKLLGSIVALDDGTEAFIADRPNRDHIYMGGHSITFTDAEKQGKLEWAINEDLLFKLRDQNVPYIIIDSGYYAKRFITKTVNFLDVTKSKRFRHRHKTTGEALDYQRSLNFEYFEAKKVLVTKL